MGNVTPILPDVDWDVLKPYWEATARGALAFPKCAKCGRFQWYPRSMCPACMSRDFSWTEIAPKGEVYTHTTVHRVWLPEAKVPFSIVQVAVTEAPGVILICNLADEAQAAQLAIHKPVVIEFQNVGKEQRSNSADVFLPFVRLI